MLHIDLRALRDGPLELAETVELDDPLVTHLECTLTEPVRVAGRIMEAGPGQYFWHGRLGTTVRTECRRCLTAVDCALDQPVEVLFTEEPDPEDPAAYGIPSMTGQLDMSDAVREELLLAVPGYVVCREDCRGLCPGCGTDLNQGDCRCGAEPDPRWAVLDALKAAPSDHVRE